MCTVEAGLNALHRAFLNTGMQSDGRLLNRGPIEVQGQTTHIISLNTIIAVIYGGFAEYDKGYSKQAVYVDVSCMFEIGAVKSNECLLNRGPIQFQAQTTHIVSLNTIIAVTWEGFARYDKGYGERAVYVDVSCMFEIGVVTKGSQKMMSTLPSPT